MQDWKMKDKITGQENAGLENERQKMQDWKMKDRKMQDWKMQD